MITAPTRDPDVLPAFESVEVLIKEARRRGRRQVWIGVAIFFALVGLGLLLVGVGGAAGRGGRSVMAARDHAVAAGASESAMHDCTSGNDPYYAGGQSLGGAVTVSSTYSTTAGEVVRWDDSRGGNNELPYTSLPSGTAVTVCYLSGNFANDVPGNGPRPEFHTQVVVIPSGGTAILDLMGPAKLPFGPPSTTS